MTKPQQKADPPLAGKYKPVVLIIMDGWGIAPNSPGNAIAKAKLPNINKYIASYPSMTLTAAGESVGLSWGEMGNSEVGHINIGAGLIFYQYLLRINKAIEDRSFFSNPAFLKAFDHQKKFKSKLHLLGLVSSGNVHASINHLFALLELAKQKKIKEVYIHVILDGRDTIFNSGKSFIEELQKKIAEIGVNAKIATISGRYYAMDRDNHWERLQKSFFAMTKGISDEKFADPIQAIESSYSRKVYDEEFVPVVITEQNNKPVVLIEDDDAIIFFNFREDRAREITQTFTLPDFNKFDRDTNFKNIFLTGMTEYDKNLPLDAIAYFPEIIKNPLAKVISDAGLKQLHIAETEKYAHVTFFINGGQEDTFPGEDRIVEPSPRVASYDLKPEMSAFKVTEDVIARISVDKYDFIIINYANADIVAHTGNLKATIKACEVMDKCIGKITAMVLNKNGAVLLTADHGNAEELHNIQTGQIDKEHSTNNVPLIIIGNQWEGKNVGLPDAVGSDLSLVTPTGVLADIAPTILKIMGIKQPKEMTGTALI